MSANMLPLGSVVLLKNGLKRLLIVGRLVGAEDGVLHDYGGVLFPEGIQGSDSVYFFDSDAIERTYGVGYQDEEEAAFRANVLDVARSELID